MLDIKKIQAMKEGEEKKFLEFVDIVERSYHELSYMKVEHKLSNTSVIRLLEEKLPKDIRTEWSKQVNNLPYAHVWNTVVTCGLVPPLATWNC